ncbi:MAG: hypothetical protein P4M09_21215 [Devosia sp.]|nr:hypothetical protein [Devosia sp.]
MNDAVEYACRLANQGEHVVLCRPDGSPYGDWRYGDPPTSQQLRLWMRSWRNAKVRVVRGGKLVAPAAPSSKAVRASGKPDAERQAMAAAPVAETSAAQPLRRDNGATPVPDLIAVELPDQTTGLKVEIDDLRKDRAAMQDRDALSQERIAALESENEVLRGANDAMRDRLNITQVELERVRNDALAQIEKLKSAADL